MFLRHSDCNYRFSFTVTQWWKITLEPETAKLQTNEDDLWLVVLPRGLIPESWDHSWAIVCPNNPPNLLMCKGIYCFYKDPLLKKEGFGLCMICFGGAWDLQMPCGNELFSWNRNLGTKREYLAKNPVSFVPLQKHTLWEKSALDSLKYRTFLYSCVLGLAVLLAQRRGMLFPDNYV